MPNSPALQVARFRFIHDASYGVRLGIFDPTEPSSLQDAGPSASAGFIPTTRAWQELVADGDRVPIEDIEFLPPVVPLKIVGIGLNYRDHAAEGNVEVPSAPMVFAKFPTALVGHDAAVIVPRHESRPDWEAELGLVIGAEAKDVASPEVAIESIGGYTAVNDVSGREAQLGDGQFVRGKSFDTFCPIGPTIHRAAGVRLDDLVVSCKVSGAEVQRATTADMVFGVGELVSYLSRQFTLQPGDVILTGTPAGTGIGHRPPRFLKAGDVMEVMVGDVGPLRNRVEWQQVSDSA